MASSYVFLRLIPFTHSQKKQLTPLYIIISSINPAIKTVQSSLGWGYTAEWAVSSESAVRKCNNLTTNITLLNELPSRTTRVFSNKRQYKTQSYWLSWMMHGFAITLPIIYPVISINSANYLEFYIHNGLAPYTSRVWTDRNELPWSRGVRSIYKTFKSP